MMTQDEILRLSRQIDDGRIESPHDPRSPLPEDERRQRFIDVSLRRAAAQAVVSPPASLESRIFAAIDAATPVRAAAAAATPYTPDFRGADLRGWLRAAAAGLVLAAGVGILAVRMNSATSTSGSVAQAPAAPGALASLSSAFGSLDGRPDPVLRSLEDPLSLETELLKEDTRRAAETVLRQLPVRIAWR